LPTTNGAGTLLYPLTDHLGSTVGMLDSSGAVVSTQKYWPYGATRPATGTLPTGKQYTGQQIEPGDSALRLYNYKARFYSTVLGRFASADGSATDGYNRFWYVRGNPMRYNDPTGRGIPLGGGLDEPSCPATNPRCAETGPPPVGGTGPDQDNCPKTLYTCIGQDPNCDAFCQGLVACAIAPVLCQPAATAPAPAATPPPVPANTADASPLPSICGSACPHQRVPVNEGPKCLACSARDAADAGLRKVVGDCRASALEGFAAGAWQAAPAFAATGAVVTTVVVTGPGISGGVVLLYTVEYDSAAGYTAYYDASQLPGVDPSAGFLNMLYSASDFYDC
jgi:RHS repeat-associated protein